MTTVFVGTSGFSYPHWGDGVFYPTDIPQSKWLEYYSTQFDTVEINASFYHLPKRSVFDGWRQRTPEDFIFVPKGSRYITHIKKLVDCEEPTNRFFEAVGGLGKKLGAVVWQFPANVHANTRKLTVFCNLLKNNGIASRVRHAFEFRHESWFIEDTYSILRKCNMACCIADSNRWPKTEELTADFVYIRFHGATSLYASRYSGKELEAWAKKCRKWLSKSLDIYLYFNNDAAGHAVANAKTLKNLLG